MKKKILIVSLLLSLIISGCGYNKQIVDLNYRFNKAVLIMGNETKEYSIKKWNDYPDSDIVQFVTSNGEVIYTHASNVIFYGNE